MSLTSLQIGISGLHTARRAMEVVSENIANVNTDSYSRRRVEQSVKARLAPMQGELPREIEAGVELTGVTRARTELLDASYRSNAANASGAQVRADVAARAEEVLGPIDGGAQDALNGFWAAWERLASRPDDLAARQEVLSAGERLASSMRSASQTLQQVQVDVAAKGAELVRDVNNYAAHIANLNTQIGEAVFRGTAPNDLLDERDALLDKLSKLTTITVVETPDRLASVYVGSYPLVDGMTPQEMVLSPSGGGPVWGVNGFPVDLSGELAAVHEALTLTLPGVQSQLDTIANELMAAMNQQHHMGTDLNNVVGGDFFNGAGAADMRIAAGLTAAGIAAGLTSAPADNRNALEIAKLGAWVPVSGKSVDDLMSELAGSLGTSAASSEQMAKILGNTLAGIDDQRSSITGVNLDEELSDLLRYQRAYEASARIMTAADEMLDVLINRTGLVGR
jgi:flagellar hook-associated protein 1 FlgK